MKKIYLLLLAFIAFTTAAVAQTKGITYQAVLYDPAYKTQTLPGVDNLLIPYANKSVCLRFQITDANNRAVYIETQSTKTDQFGMVNLIIGQGDRVGGLVNSFEAINWNAQANGLIVALDNNGSCANFTEVSSQPFTASPFSMATTSINVADYEIIANKSNDITLDAASTVKYPTVAAIKSYVDSRNANATPDATPLILGKIQLAGDLGGSATAPTVPGLLLKANTTDVTTSLALKEDAANKSNTALGSSTTLFPTQNAVKTYVDSAVAGATIADATSTTLGKIQLAGDLGGSATVPTVPGLLLKANTADVTTSLASKEDVANKSNATLGTSTILFPTQNAVKTYVDAAVAGATIADATSTTLGKIQLSGDLGGSATAPTVPGLLLKENTITAGTNSQYFRGDKTWQSLDKTAVGLGNVDNTTDANKPVSTATQTALDLKAPLASPIFTGDATATTATAGDNDTSVATTAFVTTANATNANLTGEVTSIGNATTVTNAAVIGKVLTSYTAGAGTVAAADTILQAIQKIDGNDALKAPSASPTLTGTPVAPTATAGTNTTQIATTAFVNTAVTTAAPVKGLVTCEGTLTQDIAQTKVTDTAAIYVSYEDTTGDVIHTTIKTRTAGTGFTVQFAAVPSTSAKINYIIVP